ncbi:MAG: hypothetical protein D6780_04365, partial [Candidatus Dadabacteria bacterium]
MFKKRKNLLIYLFFCIFLQTAFLFSSFNLYAETAKESQNARARLSPKSSVQSSQAVFYTPLFLEGGAELTVVSQGKWNSLVSSVTTELKSAHRRLLALFNAKPSLKVTMHILDEELFYSLTGAPRWTNALYLNKKILLPVSSTSSDKNYKGLLRTVRHEYLHAVVDAISSGRCPGWLDEGLAQWFEHSQNPILEPALFHWLRYNDPIPFKELESGFTSFKGEKVPVSYAQSLWAVKYLLKKYGSTKIGYFLKLLGKGYPEERAFKRSFNITLA